MSEPKQANRLRRASTITGLLIVLSLPAKGQELQPLGRVTLEPPPTVNSDVVLSGWSLSRITSGISDVSSDFEAVGIATYSGLSAPDGFATARYSLSQSDNFPLSGGFLSGSEREIDDPEIDEFGPQAVRLSLPFTQEVPPSAIVFGRSPVGDLETVGLSYFDFFATPPDAVSEVEPLGDSGHDFFAFFDANDNLELVQSILDAGIATTDIFWSIAAPSDLPFDMRMPAHAPSPANQRFPHATVTPGGNRFVVFEDDRHGADAVDIRLTVLDGEGQILSEEVISERPGLSPLFPQVQTNVGGRVLAVWPEFALNSSGITGRCFEPDGTAFTRSFNIEARPFGGSNLFPKLGADSQGNFIVGWSYGQQFLGRVLDANCQPVGKAFSVNGPQEIVNFGGALSVGSTHSLFSYIDAADPSPLARAALFDTTSVPPAPRLFSAVLPLTRVVGLGDEATFFISAINASNLTATGCQITSNLEPFPVPFSYVETDPATNVPMGQPDAPYELAPGELKSFVGSFMSETAFPTQDMHLLVECENSDPAPLVPGLSSFSMGVGVGQPADIVALAATLLGDGIVRVDGDGAGIGTFAVATSNVGGTGTITVRVGSTLIGLGGPPIGDLSLTLDLSICMTDANSGLCLADPQPELEFTTLPDENLSFAIFVLGNGDPIPFDPARSRLFVEFLNGDGQTVGATSVAVRSVP